MPLFSGYEPAMPGRLPGETCRIAWSLAIPGARCIRTAPRAYRLTLTSWGLRVNLPFVLPADDHLRSYRTVQLSCNPA